MSFPTHENPSESRPLGSTVPSADTAQRPPGTAPAGTASAKTAPRKKKNWGAIILLSVILLGLAVALVFILSAVIPVQWAQFIGNTIHGRIATGSLYGFIAGLVLTWVSLTVAWQARRRMSWTWRIVLIVLAIVISVPNLLTAAVAFGTSEAVHAAQRIIAVDATFFPTSTGWGAIAGAVLFVIGSIGAIAYRSRGRKLKQLKQEQAAHRAAQNV
jgi:signal transduction histidine kinase